MQDFFKVAVSFCGNHDNRGYNAGWGETYHGQLVVNEDNDAELQDNYETASNQYYAKNLIGKLLLIHGALSSQTLAFIVQYLGSYDTPLDPYAHNMSQYAVVRDLLSRAILCVALTLGEMDENVHFSLSMKVANELIKENKDFDMLIVPNTDHSGERALTFFFLGQD